MMSGMKTSSAKSKGRRLQQLTRSMLLSHAPELQGDDIISTSMGCGGEDLRLSPRAREIYPISIENKCQEAINIWAAFEQAKDNAGTHIPVLVYSRNRSDVMVSLRFEDFLKLYFRNSKTQESDSSLETVTQRHG